MTRRAITSFVGKTISFSVLLMTMHAGCGLDRLRPALPDLMEGLSLDQLEKIQNDERLTDDEKREAIRTAADIPDTDEGDRLVEFLLNFVVP